MDALKEQFHSIIYYGSTEIQSKICNFDDNEGILPNFILDYFYSQRVIVLMLLEIQEENKQLIMLDN